MKLNYINKLDGLRAFAALMVIFFHFVGGYGEVPALLKKISMFGQTGVDLFFVLSGFLITRILISSKTTDEYYFSNFYIKRTLRIFPLYYGYLLIFYFIMPLLQLHEYHGFSQQIYHYVFLQNIAMTFHWDFFGPIHYWSLGIEEHFYLFWPLVVYFCNIKQLRGLIWGILIGAVILRYFMAMQNMDVYHFTFARFDGLAIGALLSVMEVNSFFKAKNKRFFIILVGITFVASVAMFVLFNGKSVPLAQASKFSVLSIFYFSIMGYLLCQDETELASKFMTNKFLLLTGKISYGLYVFHPMVMVIVSKYLKTSVIIVDFAVVLILTYLVAWLSHTYFESYFLKFRGALLRTKKQTVNA